MDCCLEKGELMRLKAGPEGLTLRCRKGTIWLTVGDGRDYLLQPGTRFVIKRGMSAIAEALDPVEMRLDSARYDGAAIAPIANHAQVRLAL